MKAEDKKFIGLFKKLLKIKTLTHEKTNELIRETYPKLEFNEKNSRVLIRPLVFYIMKKMEPKQDTMEQIFELIDQVYPKLYKNPNTLDNYFTEDVRQPVAKRFPTTNGEEHIFYTLAKEMVALPDDVKGKILKDSRDKVTVKLRNVIDIELNWVLDIIQKYIVSTDPMMRCIALLIASGSRTIEFFGKSDYTVYKFEDSKSWVTQNYIAKKRGLSAKTDKVIKPIIYFTNEQFIEERKKALEELKTIVKNKPFYVVVKDKEKLAGFITERANISARKIFQNREYFTAHTCRSLYALVAYELFGRKKSPYGKSLEFRQFISDSLGKEGSESATREYSKFNLIVDVKKDEVPAKTQMLEKKVEEMEERLDSLDINANEAPVAEIVVKNAKETKYVEMIKAEYENYNNKNKFYPNTSKMEVIMHKKVPRRLVRAYVKYRESN
jgi:hypothetical protein